MRGVNYINSFIYTHLTQICIRQLAEKNLIRWVYTQKLKCKPEFLWYSRIETDADSDHLGFGLVAALAWNNVIQEFVATNIKPFLPSGSGLTSPVIYSVIVTILAVSVTYQLSKLIDRVES